MLNQQITVLKKELYTYFFTPMAYIFIGILLSVSGIIFMNILQYNASVNMTDFFAAVSKLIFIFCPLLAIRCFAEEKRTGTIELLKTAPLTSLDIVIGKYIGVLSVFTVYVSFLFIFPLVMEFYTDLYWPELLCQFSGLYLLGAAVIGFGMIFSAVTENQVIAGITAIFFTLFLLFLSFLVENNSGILRELFKELTIIIHYNSFVYGLLELKNIIYFVMCIVFSIFVSTRLLEL